MNNMWLHKHESYTEKRENERSFDPDLVCAFISLYAHSKHTRLRNYLSLLIDFPL